MSAKSCKAWRVNNPERASYLNIKSRAKQRGIPFTISFEYFLQFCRETEYIQNKGKTVMSYSVDRKIDALGYVEGNLQILPLGINSSKENARRKLKILRYDWQTRTAYVEDITREKSDDSWMDSEQDKGW